MTKSFTFTTIISRSGLGIGKSIKNPKTGEWERQIAMGGFNEQDKPREYKIVFTFNWLERLICKLLRFDLPEEEILKGKE